MWSALSYHGTHQLYVPRPNGDRWGSLEDDVALPIFMPQNRKIIALHTLAKTQDLCGSLSVVTNKRIESLCVFCDNSIQCSLSNDAFERTKKLVFKSESGTASLWEKKYIQKIRNTIEIPFLCLYEEVHNLLTMDFELAGIFDLDGLSFDKERIIRNAKLMLKTGFGKMKRLHTVNFYVERKPGLVKNSPHYARKFNSKLKALIEQLSNMTDEEFNRERDQIDFS